MPATFAHSEHDCKTNVRHLRRADDLSAGYYSPMALRLKELRIEAGLTVEQLAARAGISKSYFSEMENGRKTINRNRLEQLGRALGVPAVEILGGAEIPEALEHHVLVMRSLSERDREAVIAHALALLQKESPSDR